MFQALQAEREWHAVPEMVLDEKGQMRGLRTTFRPVPIGILALTRWLDETGWPAGLDRQLAIRFIRAMDAAFRKHCAERDSGKVQGRPPGRLNETRWRPTLAEQEEGIRRAGRGDRLARLQGAA